MEALGITTVRHVTAHAVSQRAQFGGDISILAGPENEKRPGRIIPSVHFPNKAILLSRQQANVCLGTLG